MWILAQNSDLLKGEAQDILVWVVLALVGLYGVTCAYFIHRQGAQDKRYDRLQTKVMKQLVRSNRAIEALANLPALVIESDYDEEE